MEAAAVIRRCARETDVVARFGGDEFAIILPDTGSEGAAQVGDRVRERLARPSVPRGQRIEPPSHGVGRGRHAPGRGGIS